MKFIIHDHQGTSTEVPLKTVRIIEFEKNLVLQYESKYDSVVDWEETIQKKDISRIEITF